MGGTSIQLILHGPQKCLVPDSYGFFPHLLTQGAFEERPEQLFMILGRCYPHSTCHDPGCPEQYVSVNISSSNGKLVHKPMLGNNDEIA